LAGPNLKAHAEKRAKVGKDKPPERNFRGS